MTCIYRCRLPVLEHSIMPKGLQSFIKEETRSGLAHNSTATELPETSTILPSNKRVNSVIALKWS